MTRTEEGGDGLKSSDQPGFDRSIFIPWLDESTREQRLQTRARIDPSFLCVLARGAVRSRHRSARRRRTRSAAGTGRTDLGKSLLPFVRGGSRREITVRSLCNIVCRGSREWRTRKSSSTIVRRRSLANGRVLGSFYGTPRLDSSWGAQALAGVSFICDHTIRPCNLIFSPSLDQFELP